MEELPKRFGGHVKRMRLQRGTSQEQLAVDAALDLSYLGGVERGQRNPSLDVMGRIAAALDTDLYDLLAP